MQHSKTVRKTGKCLGSFVCMNDQCPKYSSGKGRNTYAFTNVGFNLFECKTCGNVADREFCGALKLTMFYPDCKVLEVFYADTQLFPQSKVSLQLDARENEERSPEAYSTEEPMSHHKTNF